MTRSLNRQGRQRILIPWVHAVLGGATAICGLWLVLQMNGILPQRLHVRAWKTLMRTTLAGYWLVALLGSRSITSGSSGSCAI